MQSERWSRCTDIFQAALGRTIEERAAFLEETCGGDESLRRKVEVLLNYHEKSGNFIAAPAFEAAPEFLIEDADELVGQRLGRYRIDAVLGIGGMGVVYLACDEQLGRKVGIKLLPQALVANEAQLKRLKREARTASALNHPNIVTIHEIGEVDGTHYIATEFIEGITLREQIANGPLPPNEALQIAQQIASALTAAHAAGIVHRDIKPENIMLRPDGYVKVLDFGIAKFIQQETSGSVQTMTQQGTIVGTTRYMSPEQVRGLAVDERTDIWSLGVVLYEMVSAQQPFDGATPTDVIISIAKHDPVPLARYAPEVPGQLQRIVQKALAKDREERHPTAKDFLTELKSLPGELEKRQGVAFRRSGILTLAAVVAALIIGWWVFSPFLHQASKPAAQTEIKSLAVLPLQNLSGDAAQEYFVDGMTDELIGELAQLTSLRVISRTSAMQYKGTKKSLPRIAHELQVDAVIEGTVQRADGRVRIRAQLIEARSDRHLWAQTYERDLQEVLKLQSDIAQAIAREVRVKTTPADLARLTSRPPVRPKAFDDYLQGRYLFWNKRTVENLHKAIAYFESAIREDPAYALPYVGVADCYNALGAVQFSALPPPEGRRRAEESALQALELDPTLAEAHSALGSVRLFNWNWSAAEEELKRAIELNPNYASAHNAYATYLISRGRMDEGFAASNRARELDPLSLAISAQRGFLLFLARRYGESIEQLRGLIATDPNHYQGHWFLAHSFAANGQLDDAIAEAEKAAALSARSPGALGILGMVYGLAGKKDEAAGVVNELLELSKQRYVTPAALVFAYTGLGDKDQAFLWMEKSYLERSNFMLFLKLVPILDPLRSDARFDEMLRRVYPPNDVTALPAIQDKSIAVLPFANLSTDRENAFFAEGVHEQILSHLATIEDLKVISRTSVMQYRTGEGRNLRAIGKELGVAHVLEGSVQRAKNRVRVHAQLIDARTDAHLWAQTYDRDTADVFAIQSEIAKAIADQLQAKLTGREEQALAAKPTDNPEAYDAYLRGLAHTRNRSRDSVLAAQKHLREAVRIDPKFAHAWALLSVTDSRAFVTGTLDPSPSLQEEAQQAAETALALQPNLGEAILAKGNYHYGCLRDYDGAVGYFEEARQLLPNNTRILESLAYVARRRGEWERSEAHFKEAERLDPRNAFLLTQHALFYRSLRRFAEAQRKLDQALEITPNEPGILAYKANIAQAEGDLARAAELLARVYAPGDMIWLTAQFYQTLLERRPASGITLLKERLALPDRAPGSTNGQLWVRLGWAQQVAGHRADAEESWRQARKELEPLLIEQPDDHTVLHYLALAHAGLGEKAAAFALAERALAANPIEKDALNGAFSLEILARVAAQTGEPDRAIAALEKVMSVPGQSFGAPLTPALLRLDPMFDPLRNNPRFEKIANSPAPESVAFPTK